MQGPAHDWARGAAAGDPLTPIRKMRAGRRLLLFWASVQLLMSAPVRRMISRTLVPAGPVGRWRGGGGVHAAARVG